ncbi:MAG: HD domain-containing protein [Crocinitomicaceae bacterium]|nr:HD domain-containing protein [Crocinitomicaceae bacterium]
MGNKKKIINDPVYGFITIRHDFILDLIDHPYFQRLRRISQLGLSQLVYPGASHNRFQHALGAMHLMQNVVDELRHKGIDITGEEEKGLLAAILLHDVGHGPFSHALEHSIADKVPHEHISSLIMQKLNTALGGRLDMAISIFNGHYGKHFLHQLVSSQLDMDRLDYLTRDSFFSGVVEGQVGSERIIKMLDVVNDQLVVEEKGIYSVEKFIVARRFMYWQVYLHKTVLSAEFMLVNVLKRARTLTEKGEQLFCTPALHYFLHSNVTEGVFSSDPQALEAFVQLDDYDILTSLKVWQRYPDRVLSELSSRIVNRNLFKIEIGREPFPEEKIKKKMVVVAEKLSVTEEESAYFVIHDLVDNRAYSQQAGGILIRMKDGRIVDASMAGDEQTLKGLNEPVKKWFIAFPELM